jgi:hypothetical protein
LKLIQFFTLVKADGPVNVSVRKAFGILCLDL